MKSGEWRESEEEAKQHPSLRHSREIFTIQRFSTISAPRSRQSQNTRSTALLEIEVKAQEMENLGENLATSAAENGRLNAEVEELQEKLKKAVEEAEEAQAIPPPQGCAPKCVVQ